MLTTCDGGSPIVLLAGPARFSQVQVHTSDHPYHKKNGPLSSYMWWFPLTGDLNMDPKNALVLIFASKKPSLVLGKPKP